MVKKGKSKKKTVEKFTEKEWGALSTEQKQELEERKPDAQSPSGGGKPKYDDSGRELGSDGVPIVNRMKEYQRKAEGSAKSLDELKMQNVRMEEQMKLIQKQVKNSKGAGVDAVTKEMRSNLSALGHDKATVDSLIKGFEALADQRVNERVGAVEKTVGEVSEGAGLSAREAILSKMSRDGKLGKLGVIKKFKSEIDKELDNYPKNLWGNEEVVRTAVARVASDHLDDILATGKSDHISPPTESAGGTPSSDGSPKSAFEQKCFDYAERHNISIDKARGIVAQKEKVDNIRKGE
jgi:hypothetical protein